MVALRGGAVEAGTSNDTVPLPCPLVVRSWIQSAAVVADHVHIELDARIWSCPLPPPCPKLAALWPSTISQVPADWVISVRCPFAVIEPRRIWGSGLTPAANSTVPSPCPVAPDLMVSHVPSAVADQAHSRAAATATDAVPPSAGSGASTACIEIPQRTI
jgi:hypothetical protein